jgi:dihydropteroate synthase
MGILNVTPDSFSDGGRFNDRARALDQALVMVEEGADIIDVGGESTRPGAAPVDPASEAARILPILRALRSRLTIPISLDTRHASVARLALDEGADIVNDISALGDAEMREVVAGSGAGLVLMHMRGVPRTMQEDPRYEDVVGEVAGELASAVAAAQAGGIDLERVAIDPGIGFGKTFDHNLELLANLGEIADIGRPLLLGVSRQAFLGKLLGAAIPEDRDVATAAACVVGLLNGARIFRVHRVRPTREALEVADAIHRATTVMI